MTFELSLQFLKTKKVRFVSFHSWPPELWSNIFRKERDPHLIGKPPIPGPYSAKRQDSALKHMLRKTDPRIRGFLSMNHGAPIE